MFSLKGLNALVIGGSSGIGRALALGLQQAEARVAIAGRTESKVAAVADELRKGDAEVRSYTVDVTDRGQLAAFLDGAIEDLGAIDILVPAQGVTVLKAAEDFT